MNSRDILPSDGSASKHQRPKHPCVRTSNVVSVNFQKLLSKIFLSSPPLKWCTILREWTSARVINECVIHSLVFLNESSVPRASLPFEVDFRSFASTRAHDSRSFYYYLISPFLLPAQKLQWVSFLLESIQFL